MLHGSAQPLQFRSGQGAVPNSGDNLPQRLDAHVSSGIETVRRSLLVAVGKDIALLIQICQPLYQFRSRLVSCKYKHTEGLAVLSMMPGYLTGLCVAVTNETQGVIPRYLLYHRVGENRDLLMVSRGVRCRLSASEVIAPDQNSYVTGIFCEKHALLGRCKTAAHNKDILACEEFSVTGGAVSNAPAAKMLLAPKPYRARMCTGG